jgi:hypothetical protein
VQVKYSGQGRGRTADLPIFRTTVMRSYPSGNVLDLHRKIHPVIGERQRTNSNETEIETAREPAPTAPTPADHCRCKLTPPTPGGPPPRRRASRPSPSACSLNQKHQRPRSSPPPAVMHAADVFRRWRCFVQVSQCCLTFDGPVTTLAAILAVVLSGRVSWCLAARVLPACRASGVGVP